MKKRYVFGIMMFAFLFFVIKEYNQKKEIGEYEYKIIEATEKAIIALDNYRNNNDFDELQKVIKELEICYKYLKQIEEVNCEEISYSNISITVSQLKSYDSDDKIVALDDLMKALIYMKENIYTVGEGYFASFVNYNMK